MSHRILSDVAKKTKNHLRSAWQEIVGQSRADELKRLGCNYPRDSKEPGSARYRRDAFAGQIPAGLESLVPSIEQMKVAFRSERARSVLEIGCGIGQAIVELPTEFEIEQCDISAETLVLSAPHLKVHQWNFTEDHPSFIWSNFHKWDVVFTRGVMADLMLRPVQMANALNNMLVLARKRILIWERPEVCERIKEFSSSDRFHYYSIER